MSTLVRYLQSAIASDLQDKMVFLGGPRQVGKTTLAQTLLAETSPAEIETDEDGYLNWDFPKDRKRILEQTWPQNSRLIVFDEIHKYARWRNLIKGYYDKLRRHHQFLVTGSARLDLYRRGGDSLLGRYHYYRLHPLSLPEIGDSELHPLLKFGGFPEPFLKQRESALRRWHLERRERVLYTDVRDLEKVSEITNLSLLVDALPERVGSPLSRKNVAHDLEVDFKTVERWISILENVYYCFRISPFGPPKIRAVKKEQKLYLWDWSEHTDDGKRWENFIASHLLKFCHFRQDTEGHVMELRFLRDVHYREVDFVVIQDKKPLFAVECKAGERSVSPHLQYFAERTSIPHFYQVHAGKRHFRASEKISVLPFDQFCKTVSLV